MWIANDETHIIFVSAVEAKHFPNYIYKHNHNKCIIWGCIVAYKDLIIINFY